MTSEIGEGDKISRSLLFEDIGYAVCDAIEALGMDDDIEKLQSFSGTDIGNGAECGEWNGEGDDEGDGT